MSDSDLEADILSDTAHVAGFPKTIEGVTLKEAGQWQNIKDGVDLYGKIREVTASEKFFAPLDLAISTVHFHTTIGYDAAATKEDLAFPHGLEGYKERQNCIKIDNNTVKLFQCF